MITGATRGLGAAVAKAALDVGEHVAASGRDAKGVERSLGPADNRLLPLGLDVTDPRQAADAVQKVLDRFGGIDVLVNNAGYGQLGAFEECTAEEIDRQFRTNLFGLLHVTREVLPVMRRQRNGHILNISSIVGYAATERASIYAASKFAVGGFSESLALEVAEFGIRVTLVQPGGFRTDFLDERSVRFGSIVVEDYERKTQEKRRYAKDRNGKQAGDPAKFARALLAIVAAEEPPFCFSVGADALEKVERKHAKIQADLERWRDLSLGTGVEELQSPRNRPLEK